MPRARPARIRWRGLERLGLRRARERDDDEMAPVERREKREESSSTPTAAAPVTVLVEARRWDDRSIGRSPFCVHLCPDPERHHPVPSNKPPSAITLEASEPHGAYDLHPRSGGGMRRERSVSKRLSCESRRRRIDDEARFFASSSVGRMRGRRDRRRRSPSNTNLPPSSRDFASALACRMGIAIGAQHDRDDVSHEDLADDAGEWRGRERRKRRRGHRRNHCQMARKHRARARVPSGTHCATARRYGRVIVTLLH